MPRVATKKTEAKVTTSKKKPDYDRELATLFQILGNENQILQRTDQKAFTLLSIIGVFMVFFIVHFLKMQMTWFIFVFVLLYFAATLATIINLILVIVPRVRSEKKGQDPEEDSNPLFFAGISQYKSSSGYSKHLRTVASDREKTYNLFANQVYSLGMINSYKYNHLKHAITSFIIAISSELLIIMALAWARAIPFFIQKFPSLKPILTPSI